MFKIVLTFLMILMAPAVFAVPALQLYVNSPDAVYNASTQTWVVNASDFELWVIAADTDTKPLYDLTLVAALGQNESPVDGGLSIDGNSVLAADYEYGSPPSWGDNAGSYPNHSIYPTMYHEMTIGLVNTAPEIVYDMEPGSTGSTNGMIFKYQISTSYSWIHFDAYGFHRESDGHFKFAPNSHDAERGGGGGGNIPEPTTILMLGLGLAGASFIRKK